MFVYNMDRKPIKNNYKTVILGDSSVGKSSIGTKFTTGDFNSFQEPTIGAAFLKGSIDLDDIKYTFEIWDTAGQERYHCLAPMYYRGAVFAIVVYDITSYDSYKNAKLWINEVLIKGDAKVIILVGNKVDLDYNRQVDNNEALEYANSNNLLFAETSAKSGENIEDIFLRIIKKFKPMDDSKNKTNQTINLYTKPKRKKFFGFC